MTGRDAFAAIVPRGTMPKFDLYATMLVDWQGRMNLVARSTIDEMWLRHFADSAQLAALTPEAGPTTCWLDLGSGAGFPALVLALLRPGTFHLVEATGKKCAFLAAVAAAVGVADRVTVRNGRIEALTPALRPDIITARACAPLTRLFDWGVARGGDARWLLLKGRSVATEIAAAETHFTFDYTLVASRTDPHARIVDARNVRRRRG